MVYNLIIWTAFGMALLIIASLYFSYLKLKINYRGIKCFISGQVLISISLFLLWFLSDETRYFITPLIAVTLISGAYLYRESVVKFGQLQIKPIDLYIIIPLGFVFYTYFLYFNQTPFMEILTLYVITAYIFVKASIILFYSRHNKENVNILSILLITIGFAGLYAFRFINILLIDWGTLNYNNIKDYQTLTVVLTFSLQILLTFYVSNIIYSRARFELSKINSGFHHSPVSMMMINNQGLVVDINNRFTEFLDYSIEQVLGKKPEELLLFKNLCHDPVLKAVLRFDQTIHNKEISVLKSDGTKKQTLISISKIDYVDQQNSIITFTDISEIYLLTEKLTDYAYYDDLTSLPNRRYLTRYYEAKVIENRRFALMCIDLDNFKQVNDTYGHVVGDEVLAFIAKRLSKSICENDFVARYAGDEFILILALEDNLDHIDDKIKKIVAAIETDIHLHRYKLKLKASIGMAEFPLHGKDLNDLVKQADLEMYKVKRISKMQNPVQP